jgi:methyl-accepting chemotaxis protein
MMTAEQSQSVEAKALLEQVALVPVLRRQLSETAGEVENSVVEVCANFQNMVRQARQTVSQAAEALEGGGENASASSVATLIERSRSTLDNLLDHTGKTNAASLDAVHRMEEVYGAMGMIVKKLADVETIARANRLLAMNARIEAVRAGSFGGAFSVVADEISAQARRSTGLAGEIADVVRSLSTAVQGVAAELKRIVAEVETVGKSTREGIESSLMQLESVDSRMRGSLAEAGRSSSELADAISRAVIGLQFQDRVSQRVGHVVEVLERIEATAAALGPLPATSAEVIEHLSSQYTMHSERATLAQTTGLDLGVGEISDSNVELF